MPNTQDTQDMSALELYFRDVSEHDLLTQEEEIQLAKRIEAGDTSAKDQLIERNQRLVVTIAKQLCGDSRLLPDKIQDGNLGLITAAERYDWRIGTKFSTYAVPWIKQSILRRATLERTIRLPVYLHHRLHRYQRIRTNLNMELGREPTISELVEATGLTEEQIEELKPLSFSPCSLDIPVGEGDNHLSDFIPDPQAAIEKKLERDWQNEVIDQLFVRLSEKEQDVLRRRFGLGDHDPQTLQEISKVYGVTRERIRQIESKALRKLRAREPYRDRARDLQQENVEQVVELSDLLSRELYLLDKGPYFS